MLTSMDTEIECAHGLISQPLRERERERERKERERRRECGEW